MSGVARAEKAQAAPVQAHAVQVLEVRILALLAAIGREVDHACICVHVMDPPARERARRDLALELAIRSVQVVVAPAVALGPVDQLTGRGDALEALHLDVGVQPLLDDGLYFGRCRYRRGTRRSVSGPC